MRKKSICLIIFVAIAVILLIVSTTHNIFNAEKINDTALNSKTRNSISQLCNSNGAFIFYQGKNNVVYLILNGKDSCFTDVKIEAKDDTIMIYFNEELKNSSSYKHPPERLIYKIAKDKDYKYIRVFKNGKETYFNGIGG